MNKEKILDLAKLARIELTEAEAEGLSGEFGTILNYVGEVKKVSFETGSSAAKLKPVLKNVLRDDKGPHETGLYTEHLLKGAPQRSGDYIKVKKIL